MICENCKTVLPDDAVACWKCGTRTPLTPETLSPKPKRDILHMLASFFVAIGVFVCFGWTVPFAVFGNISSAASSLPQWASISGVASGPIMIGTAVAFVALTWWGSYWVISRLFAKASA
jgi:ribosomal protein L40E